MYKIATVKDLFSKNAAGEMSPSAFFGLSKRTYKDPPFPEILTPKEKLVQQQLAKLYPDVPGPLVGWALGPGQALKRTFIKYPQSIKAVTIPAGALVGVAGGLGLSNLVGEAPYHLDDVMRNAVGLSGAMLGHAYGNRLASRNADIKDIERATYAVGESRRLAKLQEADPVAFAKAMRSKKIQAALGGVAASIGAAANTALPILLLGKALSGGL
jgi:hypothetical protein